MAPPRLTWVEGTGFAAWGCSECAWFFQPPVVPLGKSLEEILRILALQRDKEFASHVCAKYPKSVS